jgi:hypothetical protein
MTRSNSAGEHGKEKSATTADSQRQTFTEPLTMTYQDAPIQVPPGAEVTIMVIEREGPQAVYADLLVNPTCSDTDTMITVDYMLGHCHQEYLAGRAEQRGYRDTSFWTAVEHIVQECKYMLETHTLTSETISRKRIGLITCLGRLCRHLLQTLRQGTGHNDPAWQEVDSCFAEVVALSARLHEEARAVSRARRHDTALPSEYFPLAELADRLGGQARGNLMNFEDLDTACKLAEAIGLDMATLEICMYKSLEAVIMLRGTKLKNLARRLAKG